MPLAWMEVGYSTIFSKVPVKVPADLEGLKVRIALMSSSTGDTG